MVLIEVTGNKGEFESLKITGHAGYEDSGKDIVCAAISAIAQGGINALEAPSGYRIRLGKGDYLLEAKNKATPHDQIVIETMIAQIESVAVSYPEYARLERK